MASIRVEQTGKQQTFPDFDAFKYGVAKPSTSLNLKILHAILLTQGAQPTPGSSAQKIAFPRWRPSWAWYLAEAPALSALVSNPVSHYSNPGLCIGESATFLSEQLFPTLNPWPSALVTELQENSNRGVKLGEQIPLSLPSLTLRTN